MCDLRGDRGSLELSMHRLNINRLAVQPPPNPEESRRGLHGVGDRTSKRVAVALPDIIASHHRLLRMLVPRVERMVA